MTLQRKRTISGVTAHLNKTAAIETVSRTFRSSLTGAFRMVIIVTTLSTRRVQERISQPTDRGRNTARVRRRVITDS